MAAERTTGCTVKDVPQEAFIAALAEHFRKNDKLELPDWHDLVKTATFKEQGPQDPNWFYVRAAALARKVYLRGGTGVGAFTKVFGNTDKRNIRTEHFRRSAKGVIRNILIQLEKADIIAKKADSKGRWITKNGRRELDVVAGTIKVTKLA